MPELAEVAFACNQWNDGVGKKIKEIIPHATSRVYRDLDRSQFCKMLTGTFLSSAQTHGKQMLFGFTRNHWMGVHLGMTGNLFIEPENYQSRKYDALILRQNQQTLVFRDPRQFGRLRLHHGHNPPDWWRNLPTSMLSKEFSVDILHSALNRHSRRPVKALLLDQYYFPGMGNWMADEVLWRSRIHPGRKSGKIVGTEEKILFKQIVFVARGAMQSVGVHGGDPPKSWLFHSRWKDGLLCPKTNTPLIREPIGGRTTCWCPVLQPKTRN